MGLFGFGELQEIGDRAIAAGLAPRREELLFGFPPVLTAALPGWGAPAPAAALKLDLGDLNEMPEPLGGEIPITLWLRNASSMSVTRPSAAQFFDAQALVAAERAGEQAAAPGTPAQPPPPPVAVPERILFRHGLLPDSFVATAALRARSVARLSVTSCEAGTPRLFPSGSPIGFFGTGWLIGKRHLITNWHVVTARAAGEAEPDPADLALQVAGMKVQFDYVTKDAQPPSAAVTGLAHGNPALDYAVIELAHEEPRDPLPLVGSLPPIDADNPMAANIIQHPAGEPRQYAIRDNLVAVIQGTDLAYFTDTAGGSSGSPVCDDQWRVIALHKASSAQFGDFSFQGKSTAWVNIGTLITAICDDLRQNAPQLWTAIGAVVV
jgi:V8-like Glu-specific endopeptidase